MEISTDALVLLATVYPIGFLVLAFERAHPSTPRSTSRAGVRLAIAVTAAFAVVEVIFLASAVAATVTAVWAVVEGRTQFSGAEAAVMIGPGLGLAAVVFTRAFRSVSDEFAEYVHQARSNIR